MVFTSNLIEERIKSLRSSSPDTLIFFGGIIGDRNEESKLHKKFKYLKSHGEWFNENEELYDFINSYTINCSKCLEIILSESQGGNMEFKDALLLSGDEILEIQRKRISKISNNVFKTIDINPIDEQGLEVEAINIKRPVKLLLESEAHKNRLK